MSFIVTARKWRPQRFDEVVGQEHISTTLKNALTSGRIAHAYLFAGPRGIGKTTTARLLAKSLNCTNPQKGEPCNDCEMCRMFQTSQSLDVIEIDGASNRRIEEVRALRESVKYAPTKGKYKIYIIDEVHMLTTESFNALLKTLEEPPEHTVFIFATTDVHKVPVTIISRCQRYDFRRIELNAIKNLLKKIADAENIKIDDESLTIIAKKADGALRDAQSLFDQVISFCGSKVEASIIKKMLNLIDEEIYFELTDAILSKDFGAAFNIAGKIYDNGWNFVDFLNDLIEHFRNILTVTIRKNSDLVETAEIFKKRYLDYQNKFSEGDLLRILTLLNKVRNELRFSYNQKLKIEISLSQLIGLEKSSTISELLKQIDTGGGSMSGNSGGADNPEYPKNSTKEDLHSAKYGNTQSAGKLVSDPHVSISAPLDLHGINQMWSNFVQSVNAEKFTLGDMLNSIRPVGLDGKNLTLSIDHGEDEAILSQNSEYFHKKTEEFFGSKLNFNFAVNGSLPSPEIKSSGNTEKIKTGNSSSKKDDSPLAEAIKNQLGGAEIKR